MVIIGIKINHIEFAPPKDWPGTELLSEFINDSVESKTTIETLHFVNEPASYLINWRLNGLTGGPGIYEGPCFEAIYQDGSDIYTIKGYFDMADGSYIEHSPVEVSCKIGRLDLLSDLEKKISGVTMALLASIPLNLSAPQLNRITSSDFRAVKYVVEQDFNFGEFFSLVTTAFMIIKEIHQLIKEITRDAGIIAGLAAGVVTAVGSILYAALEIVFNLIFAVALFATLLGLLKDIVNYVFPNAKHLFGITLHRALTRIFAHAGFGFKSFCPELEHAVLLPSKPKNTVHLGSSMIGGFPSFAAPKNPNTAGIPNPGNYGYMAIDIVELAKKLCKGKLHIDDKLTYNALPNGTIELHPFNDPFWKTQSAFQCKDVLNEAKQFNAPDLESSRMISYVTDISDAWTVEKMEGSKFEINVKPLGGIDSSNVSISGFEETNFGVALGVRKNELNEIENAVKLVALKLDSVAGRLKSAPSNLAIGIVVRQSFLKIWNPYFDVPKLVYADKQASDGGWLIPDYHLAKIGAKALYSNYLNVDSFVANNFAGQKRTFTDLRVPMTFKEWMVAKKNRFFKLADGTWAEFTMIKHSPDTDTALISGYIPEVFTKNLKETYIEVA